MAPRDNAHEWLPDGDQPELAIPDLQHVLLDGVTELLGLDAHTGLGVRQLKQVGIACEVAGAQLWQSRLAGAEKIAGAPYLQVALGQHKAVLC